MRLHMILFRVLLFLTFVCVYYFTSISYAAPIGPPEVIHDKSYPLYQQYLEWKNNNKSDVINTKGITIHVSEKIGVDERGDGSIKNPYKTIQKAVDEADNGDTVLIEDGIYTGLGNTNIIFSDDNITVRSENGPENCVIDCENIYECGFIIYYYGIEIDGFTIKNGLGYPRDSSYGLSGGGIYCSGTFQKTIIRNNYICDCATDGIVEHVSEVLIENNTIKNCSGFGFHGDYGVCVLKNNTICDNASGGVWVYEDIYEIENCLIYGNEGYGVAIYESTDLSIINSTISENDSGIYARLNDRGPININTSNTIIYNDSSYELTWSDGLSSGGGIINISFTDFRGGYNSIAPYEPTIYGIPPTINWLEGNINLDPKFIDASADFHLSDYSPCIGAGTSENAPLADMEGTLRGSPPDMGAYENILDEPLPQIISIAEAAGNGYVHGYAYIWNGCEYVPVSFLDADTSIQPWKGFWAILPNNQIT